MAEEDFGLYRNRRSKQSTVAELMKVPTKDSKVNMPKRDPRFIEDMYVHQADLLFLPDDKGYKYALVVVDIGSGICDEEPLKNKTQYEVLSAFKRLYARDHLDIPKAILQIDNGTEFKGVVAKWFSKNQVMIRRGQPGRHRQQANVESVNGTIARAIFYKLHEEELETGEVATAWTHNLPPIINLINKHMQELRLEEKKKPADLDIRCEGQSCRLLETGQKVRRILDEPKDTTGIKLTGKFRKTDTRFENEIRIVEAVILQPSQPPLYQISGLSNVLFTRNQLQIIK